MATAATFTPNATHCRFVRRIRGRHADCVAAVGLRHRPAPDPVPTEVGHTLQAALADAPPPVADERGRDLLHNGTLSGSGSGATTGSGVRSGAGAVSGLKGSGA